jgi:hypothetical protein
LQPRRYIEWHLEAKDLSFELVLKDYHALKKQQYAIFMVDGLEDSL